MSEENKQEEVIAPVSNSVLSSTTNNSNNKNPTATTAATTTTITNEEVMSTTTTTTATTTTSIATTTAPVNASLPPRQSSFTLGSPSGTTPPTATAASTPTTNMNCTDQPLGSFHDLEEIDLPPLRVRVPNNSNSNSYERLSISSSNLMAGPMPPQRRRSLPMDLRSRSRSPSLRGLDGMETNSLSSLEDDIFTDRMGLEELEYNPQQSSQSQMHSLQNSGGSNTNLADHVVVVTALPSVNERLSEDTLEDVHAFTDITPNVVSGKSASRANSIANSSDVGLDTLEEEEEEEDDDDEGVHISNMEHLTIHEDEVLK